MLFRSRFHDAINYLLLMLAIEREKPKPKVDVNDEASAKVKKIDTRIKALRDRIVTAKAKGDTKEVDHLRNVIAKLRDKKVDVRANVRKTGVTTIKATNVGNGLKISAYRTGGRPKVGQIAQFHKDEFWVPDSAGTVMSQARSRSMMGTGPAAMGGAGGNVYNFNANQIGRAHV